MADETGRRGSRTVRLKPSSYQPSKAELEEAFKIDVSPEEAALAVAQPARIVTTE